MNINTQAISNMVKGTTMVSAQIETIPDMRKTGNPFNGKHVVKSQTLNGVIGYDYQNAINRLSKKEGKETVEAKPRTWGELSKDRVWVHHKGESYLRMKVEKTKDIKYFVDGKEVDASLLKPFFPNKSKSSTQAHLDGEVIERDVKISNVKSLKIKGMTIS